MIKNTGKAARLVALALTTFFATSVVSGAMAETQWSKDHPRRHQVNQRLKNQDRRIHKERRQGEISRRQAAGLHRQDRQIRHEERDMASQNGGHITKQEQRTLNQQENSASRKIGE